MLLRRGGAIAGLRRTEKGAARFVPGNAGRRGDEEGVDRDGAEARGSGQSLAGVAFAGVAPVVTVHGGSSAR